MRTHCISKHSVLYQFNDAHTHMKRQPHPHIIHTQVKSVVHLLLSNLDTPSQQVQEAIASCLPPLASVVKPNAEDIIKKLMDKVSISFLRLMLDY